MEQKAVSRGTADSAAMRSVNRTLVLEAIKRTGPISRTGVAKSVSLAKPTVSVIVDDLLGSGLVRELGTERGGPARGRPPVLLEFNARSQFVAGVHIGVQASRLVLADATGHELARCVVATPHGTPAAALMEIAAALDELIDASGIARGLLAAVGICVPGLVEPRIGTCVHAPNLGWRDVPVAEILAARIGASMFVHNGTQAAAAAEQVEGAGRGARTMALLYVGTGIGAAVVEDGRVFHGSTGMAGEIGHALMPGATETCGCGKEGCLETVASGPAIARAARRAIEAGRPTRLAGIGGPPTVLDVVAAARAGDELAIELVSDAGHTLGIAAAWLANFVNPDVLVIGGAVVGAGDLLLDPLRETVRRHAMGAVVDGLRIRPWALGQDAKVRGAVILALQLADQSYRLVFGAS